MKKLLRLLGGLYPGATVTDDQAIAWYYALQPFSYADCREAALQHARENKFYPRIAEICERIQKQKKSTELERLLLQMTAAEDMEGG